MPQVSLTPQQAAAINRRDVSVSLSAGAGCGKTLVLTQRFLSHLDPTVGDDETQLRQLIAITFTDAAAREMRTRIRNACYEKLDDATLSTDQRAAWQRLLREIDTARVSTIHAFCTALLRSHAPEAGLDPLFGVLEPAEAEILLYETLDDVLRERLAEHDPDTLDLAALFGRLSQLKECVSLFVDERHRPAFARWLASEDDMPVMATEIVAAWRKRYDKDATRLAILALAEKAPIADLLRLLARATPGAKAKSKGFPAKIATLTEILSRLASHPETVTPPDLQSLDDCARVKSICDKEDWPSVEDYEAYKAICHKMRTAANNAKPPRWDDAAAREAAALGLRLLRLASDVADQYALRKQQQAKLDFDDQLALAHRLLTSPERAAIRDALSADLRLLLVDEFQDTDPLQVEIIKQICGPGFDEGRLFFVGDSKQSIYRFRGAVPAEFQKLREEIPDAGRQQLTDNFRSQPGVLHFVNALFHDAFADGAPLRPQVPAGGESACVEFLWRIPEVEPAGARATAEVARRQEAQAIAVRLRQLIEGDSGELPVCDRDSKQQRQLRPGNVAILFRALSDVRYYEEALREQGLEYYLVGGHAFYAQQEIFDVLNLLRAIASTADEVSLAGVLRSPFFALTDESIFWLAQHGRSLNDALSAPHPPPELTGEEQAKVVAAAGTIRDLRAIKDTVPIAVLLNEALDRTGYDAVLLTEFLGERKLANLEKLVEHARVADANHNDLTEFILQLSEFIARPPKEPLASTSSESADVIRLMTIHRAKGLEFPFVVVPDLNRMSELRGPSAALDDELGPLLRIPKEEGDEETATGMTLYVARERAAELDERKRLLYVATTRARDYLLLTSSLESLHKLKSDWMKLIAQHFDLATGECIAELPAGFERPRRVHIAPPLATVPKPMSQSRGPDLIKMLEETHELAAAGQGIVPAGVPSVAVDRAARRQYSFSQLSGALVAVDDPVTSLRANEGSANGIPVLVALPPSPGVSAALPLVEPLAFGSLVHDALQRIDFSRVTPTEIGEWCQYLSPQYVTLNTDKAARAAEQLIARFADSPRGRELATAKTLHREIEFLLAWPANASHTRGNSTEPGSQSLGESKDANCYIRGFIDCLYQDATGNWRVVDFKTNDVSPASLERTIERYELQLYVYALAVEQSLNTSPKELVLELLRPAVEHVIPWNAAARTRAIKHIDAALQMTTLSPSSFSPPP